MTYQTGGACSREVLITVDMVKKHTLTNWINKRISFCLNIDSGSGQ